MKKTKTEFTDQIHINHGTAIITIRNGHSPFLNPNFIDRIEKGSTNAEIDHFINKETLLREANNSIAKMYLSDAGLKKSDSIKDFLQQYYTQNYLVQLVVRLEKVLPQMSIDAKTHTLSCLKRLTELLSRDLQIKTHYYWFAINKVNKLIIQKEFEEASYSYKDIQPIIFNYDSITRQYLLLLAIKNNLHTSENGIRLDTAQNNLYHLTEYITYEGFKSYSKKFKSGNSNKDYINNSIKKCVLYDYNLKQIHFNDIFTNSTQKYILFDFCGSWCIPCMQELKEYNSSKKLDTSAIVKPVWIFFENNKTDWLPVIEKYQLKKENCFLIEGPSEITTNFQLLFSWRRVFPQHFLFNQQGKIIDRDAPSFTNFDPQTLVKQKVHLNSVPPQLKN